jgi:hypothetical protein
MPPWRWRIIVIMTSNWRLTLRLLALLPACAFGQQAPASAPASSGEWHSMFDGKSLANWKETDFTGRGKVRVEDGAIVLGTGYMTGINWTPPFPKINYEIRLEAARLQGSDFFAAITFPVADTFCSWINGGWGGSLVGLSSLEGNDASENETSTVKEFQKGRWYALRLQVTDQHIAAWIDEENVIYVKLEGRTVDLRPGEIELSKPLGIASYSTTAALRKIEYRVLPAGEARP